MSRKENPLSQEECNPFYEDRELGIRFIPNRNDSPDGYFVFIRDDSFCLPSRCLQDLAHPDSSTKVVQRSLEAINPLTAYILEKNMVSYEQMQIAFLKVKLLEERKFAEYLMEDRITDA